MAAVADRPTVATVTAVIGPSAEHVLQPAVDAQVVRLEDGIIEFTHPLRAFAAKSLANAPRLREIHGRLAELLADPEQRARHLALATVGPDEHVAASLDAAAPSARARGALGAASELAEQAWRLTPADRPADLRRRKLCQARYLIVGGSDLGRCRVLLEDVLSSCPQGPDTAEPTWMLGWLHLTGLDWHGRWRCCARPSTRPVTSWSSAWRRRAH